MRAIRALFGALGLLLVAAVLGWALTPFLVGPGELTRAGPVLAVVAGCAWGLVACLCWFGVGVLVTLYDLARARDPRPTILAPALVRRVVVVVCIGVGLTGSVAGVAAAAEPAPATAPEPAPAAARLDRLVVPDRAEDGSVQREGPAERGHAAPGGPVAPAERGAASGRRAQDRAGAEPSQAQQAVAPAHPASGASEARPRASDTSPRRAAGTGSADTSQAGHGETVVVRPGDSLWAITADLLPGHADAAAVDAAWRELYAANRPPLGADPDLIHPGDLLRVPRDLTPDREESR